MIEDTAVHMIMGQGEAHLIATALDVLLGKIDEDLDKIEDKTEEDRKFLMLLLSMKFSTSQMYASINETLGYGTAAEFLATEREE